MANYPSGVYSPATINDGETVSAAHQNEPNNEINAIEDALVNGNIAHHLTPDSASTRTIGTIAKPWKEVWADGIAARVRKTDSTSVSSGASTIGFSFDNQVDVNPSSWHSTSANSSRLTFPSSGWFHLVGNARIRASTAGTGQANLQITINDSTIAGSQGYRWEASSGAVDLCVSAIYRANAAGLYAGLQLTSSMTEGLSVQVPQHYGVTLSAFKV